MGPARGLQPGQGGTRLLGCPLPAAGLLQGCQGWARREQGGNFPCMDVSRAHCSPQVSVPGQQRGRKPPEHGRGHSRRAVLHRVTEAVVDLQVGGDVGEAVGHLVPLVEAHASAQRVGALSTGLARLRLHVEELTCLAGESCPRAGGASAPPLPPPTGAALVSPPPALLSQLDPPPALS